MPKMTSESNSQPPGREPLGSGHADGEKVVDSRELLGGRNEVVIHHEGRLYRLRRTRLGKLILTA